MYSELTMMVFQQSDRLMASQRRSSASSGRPTPTRVPSHPIRTPSATADPLTSPKRAHTFHNDGESGQAGDHGKVAQPDAFETSEHTDNDDAVENTRNSIELDDLPIELITLTDRY